MNDLDKLWNSATALRKRYYADNVPYKDFRAKVLGYVIDSCFVYGKIPSSFKLQFPTPVNSIIILNTLEDLFSDLSMEIKIQTHDEKWTESGSVYYAVYTLKEKSKKT